MLADLNLNFKKETDVCNFSLPRGTISTKITGEQSAFYKYAFPLGLVLIKTYPTFSVCQMFCSKTSSIYFFLATLPTRYESMIVIL